MRDEGSDDQSIRLRQKWRCTAVPRRARMQGSQTIVSLNSRRESNKEEEEAEEEEELGIEQSTGLKCN